MSSTASASSASAPLQPPYVVRRHVTGESSQLSEAYSEAYSQDSSFHFEGTEDEEAALVHHKVKDTITILSAVDLMKEQEEQIEQIASLFSVSRLTASTLLRAFHWKVGGHSLPPSPRACSVTCACSGDRRAQRRP